MFENDKFVLPEQDVLMQCTGSETAEIRFAGTRLYQQHFLILLSFGQYPVIFMELEFHKSFL